MPYVIIKAVLEEKEIPMLDVFAQSTFKRRGRLVQQYLGKTPCKHVGKLPLNQWNGVSFCCVGTINENDQPIAVAGYIYTSVSTMKQTVTVQVRKL